MLKYLNTAVSVMRGSGQIEPMGEGSWVRFSEQVKLIWSDDDNFFTSTFLCHFASAGVCSCVAKLR